MTDHAMLRGSRPARQIDRSNRHWAGARGYDGPGVTVDGEPEREWLTGPLWVFYRHMDAWYGPQWREEHTL